MTDATAHVEGPGANHIARSLLNSLGVDPDDVEELDVSFTTDSGTSVHLDADGGDEAGVIVSQMVTAVDWDETPAVAIDVSATTTDPTPSPADTDDEAEPEAEPPSEADDRPAVMKPRVTPLADVIEDPAAVEYPGEPPGRVQQNTQAHVLTKVLARWAVQNGDSQWADGAEIVNLPYNPLSESQTRRKLSDLFLSHGLVIRRPRTQKSRGRGREYVYHPTEQLVEEAERLGAYDADSVAGLDADT